jgi:UDP-4-amino-4,6-dideoxy-N-acetyl-beta-L-altrosamine N-acetyltransferase
MRVGNLENARQSREAGIKCLKQGLSFQKLQLRELTSKYTDSVVNWRNDPNNGKWFKSQTTITNNSHEAWLKQRHEGDVDVNWIVLHDDEGAIGLVSLYNIDWTTGSAEFGRFMIGKSSALGNGFGMLVVKMVLCLSSAVGLDRIKLEVKPNNERAIRLYKKAGFKIEKQSEMVFMSRSVIGYSDQIDAPY